MGTVVGAVMIFSDNIMVRMDDETALDKGYEIIRMVEVPLDHCEEERIQIQGSTISKQDSFHLQGLSAAAFWRRGNEK